MTTLNQDKMVCPYCKGSGWKDSYSPVRIDVDDCSYCNGTGFIIRRRKNV